MTPGPVSSQALPADRHELLSGALPDMPSFWAEPGRPGFFPDAWWCSAYPPSFAGHVRGAWRAEDPFMPGRSPYPGVMSVEVPLAWLDSLSFGQGDAVWRGFDGAIASAHGEATTPEAAVPRRRARGDLLIAGGSSAYDQNALALSRADSVWSGRVGVGTWNRGGIGTLGLGGGHHYEAGAAWRRKRHRVSGAFAHRGAAAALEQSVGQDVAGAEGELGYGYGFGAYELGLELARAYDRHESFGVFLPYSRRDAQRTEAAVEWSGSGKPWSARVEVRDAQVTRVTEDSVPVRAEAQARSIWLALGAEGGRGPARFRAALGAGRDGGTRRTEIAPSLAFTFGEGPFGGRLFFERVLAPVWSDLAPGQGAFLQSTWLGGFDVSAGDRRGFLARVGWRMGRTRDRAVVPRLPLEELWLRLGFEADPEPYDFGLGTLEAQWRLGRWRASVEGYQLLREAGAIQPAVDPRRGGRAALEVGLRAFKGDLGIGLRGEAEGMSGRESELGAATWIPGFVSFGSGAVLTLADATLALRFRNLENRQRRETWPDPLTGEQAIGPGTEFRLVFSWRLYN